MAENPFGGGVPSLYPAVGVDGDVGLQGHREHGLRLANHAIDVIDSFQYFLCHRAPQGPRLGGRAMPGRRSIDAVKL
ncbi:hypothetical protein Acy02nite_02850 [Actinoplanes cyaneus]|uniref:Uncharacterized protein n=1 Tax=Actinoplanes cyaneus TaxID=52696 RepID=A0A919M4K5_9ACTN|nr:hypothetical protein Acy02nite_02850 [Actinoplanes cyaneus]